MQQPTAIHDAYEIASRQGLSLTSFEEFATLDEAVRYTLTDKGGADAALTRAQAVEFLKRHRGQLERQPVMLMRETRESWCGTWNQDEEEIEDCPHCGADIEEGLRDLGVEGGGASATCPACGLGLEVLLFTDVQDDDIDEREESIEEFAEGYEWFRLWPRG